MTCEKQLKSFIFWKKKNPKTRQTACTLHKILDMQNLPCGSTAIWWAQIPEALGDNAHLPVRLPDSSWWHHDRIITLRMRHCQSASKHNTNCCWNICLQSAHVQSGAWATNHYKLTGGLKFPIVHVHGNITVPKKCYCTKKTKLLWYLKVRRLSATYSGCTFFLYKIQMSAWPVTRLLSWSLGYWQQDNTDQLS